MRRKSISVPGLHHGEQPIPLASVVDNFLISGGVLGMDPANGKIPEDPKVQCSLMFENIERIMKAAGGSLEDIIRLTVFLKDTSLRKDINNEWVQYFPDEQSRPSRQTIFRELAEPIKIQCEVYAVLKK